MFIHVSRTGELLLRAALIQAARRERIRVNLVRDKESASQARRVLPCRDKTLTTVAKKNLLVNKCRPEKQHIHHAPNQAG